MVHEASQRGSRPPRAEARRPRRRTHQQGGRGATGEGEGQPACSRFQRRSIGAVPIDPLAGPVVNLHMPARAKAAHAEPQTSMAAAAAQAASPLPAKPNTKTAGNQAEDLQARAEAIAKTLAGKPAAIAAAKTEANAPAATAAPRTLQHAPKPAAAKVAEAAKPAAKPAEASKAVAKAKDTIPGLRMSANAY